MSSTLKNGVINKFQFIRTGQTGWKNYKFHFEDGTVLEAAIPPSTDYEPKEGDHLYFKEGKYGPFLDVQETFKGTNGFTSDDYWKRKFEYESTDRDPKIEFQFYFDKVLEACLKKENWSLDRSIEYTYNKAKELMNKSVEEET